MKTFTDYLEEKTLYLQKKGARTQRVKREGPTIRKVEFVQIGTANSDSRVDDLAKTKTLSNEEHLRKIKESRTSEDLTKGEMTSIQEGFLYLISNPAWPQWIKAGMTIDYESRLGSYNISDPTQSFKYERIRWTSNRRISEINLLKTLSESADSAKGEWFKIELPLALSILNEMNL